MRVRNKILIICTLIIFNSFLIFQIYYLRNDNQLEIAFLNIGQGDSILVRTPKNGLILIDAGKDYKVLNELGKNLSYFENEFDIVVATHDDLDHIGGLKYVLEKYKVNNLFISLPESENSEMKNLINLAKTKNINLIIVEKTKIVNTLDGVKIEFLFPITNIKKMEDGNEASIVNKITYGDFSFLTTGDLGKNGEILLVNLYGDYLQSSILKLGHHGSDTSSHIKFLQTVNPKVAIVSAGINNSFGHPHKSVIDLLNKLNIKYFETKDGAKIFKSDGLSFWLE